MKIIKPPRLQKGDTVGIIAPSKAPNPRSKSQFEQGIKNLESFGLKVNLGKHVYDNEYFNGATLENRLADLHSFFANPDIKMVMMALGGKFANMMLDHIDYDLIKKNPKIFCGMSDGTLLVNAIYQKTGLSTFYGPNLQDAIGVEMSPKMRENFHQTFFEGTGVTLTENADLNLKKWMVSNCKGDYEGWEIVRSGKASGHLVGGFLSRLITMDYAGYKHNLKGAILFFESNDDANRMFIPLSTLKQRGVFDQINGLIVGHCTNSESQKSVSEMISEITKGYDFPILKISEMGHNVENYAFPIGCQATIDTEKKQITIDEQTVI